MKNSTHFYVGSTLLFQFFLFYILLSCEKVPVNFSDFSCLSNDNVKQSKFFSESQTHDYKFVTSHPKGTKSSSTDVFLEFDWSNPIVVHREHASAVEVPLTEGTEREVYLREYISEKITLNGNYHSTTRLIVRYDKKTKQYEQFIITKIWYKGRMPSIESISFNDLNSDAITVIYDVKGKITAEYKKDGMFYTFHPLQSDSLANRTRLLISDKEIETATPSVKTISDDDNNIYLCKSCNLYCESFICSHCKGQAEMVVADIQAISGITLVKEICEIYGNAIAYAINRHNCGNLCYGRTLDIVEREFCFRAMGIYPISLAQDIYLLSNSYNPSFIRNRDAANLYSKWGEHLLKTAKDTPFFVYSEIADSACAFACGQTPSIGGGGGSGSTGGGVVNPPNPETTCNHEKCRNRECRGCLNAEWTTCQQCHCLSDIDLLGPLFVSLGEEYSIIANVTSPKSIARVTLDIRREDRDYWVEMKTFSGTETCMFTRQATLPGRWVYRAKVVFTDGSVSCSSSKMVEKLFPDYQHILNGDGVVSHFESLWEDTKKFAEDNKSRHCVREYGCVVYYDAKNKTYSFEDVVGPEYVLNSAFKKADITFTIEDDIPLHPLSEKNTYKYYVATFHTHPPLIGADDTFESELQSGPSTADINNLEKGPQMPAFVYCYKNTIDKYSKIDDAAGIVIVKENYQRRVIKLN